MDYIQFAIDELEKNNRGISAHMARDQYIALKKHLAQLESAQQSVQRTCATCGKNYALTDFILGNGKHICGHCGASR